MHNESDRRREYFKHGVACQESASPRNDSE